jgi:hypothetical protein
VLNCLVYQLLAMAALEAMEVPVALEAKPMAVSEELVVMEVTGE